MNVKDTRRKALQALIDEDTGSARGRQARCSKRIGKSPAQISQWLSGYRTIDDESAREIERAAGKSRWWMDGGDAYQPPPPPTTGLLTPLQPIPEHELDAAQDRVDADLTADLKLAVPAFVAALARLTPGQWKMARVRLDEAPGAPTETIKEVIRDVLSLMSLVAVGPDEPATGGAKPKAFRSNLQPPAAPSPGLLGRTADQRGAAPTVDATDEPQ